ncbi:hypothetical protein [Mucilaginibacter polytrichastri]|uniref:Uncharacterized protein n=1 Tax=Mucilaginibacter polytrichastri TaxID=1302689 RepID=A0A1Q6A2Z2_9SPHI|nr:hypothetical protein [Mucilaginibacter polytrichastri]OKS88361.1 hypothetical protein RG47T_3827 [Mucilaginibacter polytrichastri]SFT14045.1 hypothetical protein SAMN04487890_11294 [Mucilaginibacter polytrichastri]
MSTIWAHLPGYSVNDHLPVKVGKAVNVKFWMVVAARLQVREMGDSYLTNSTFAEYEFGGKVISEMTINGMLVLVIDTGAFQFYIENGRASEGVLNNGYFGKFVRGKGRLALGEYPYSMGVEEVKATPQQIIKVTVPQSHILNDNGTISVPLYLLPDEYTEADTLFVDEITDSSNNEAFYLVHYQLV